MSTGGRGGRWIAPFIKQGWLSIGKEGYSVGRALMYMSGHALPSPFQRGSGRGEVHVRELRTSGLWTWEKRVQCSGVRTNV